MSQDEEHPRDHSADEPARGYRPPTVTFLGTLAELTKKQVGGADGDTFLGIDIS